VCVLRDNHSRVRSSYTDRKEVVGIEQAIMWLTLLALLLDIIERIEARARM